MNIAAGRGRLVSLVTVAVAILPLLILGIVKLVFFPRPFWVWFYDPENIYFSTGLRLLRGEAPINVDNPGTPLMILSAALAPITGVSILRFDAFLDLVHPLLFLLHLAAALLLARGVFGASDPILQVASVWAYFAAPSAFERALVWSPEGLFFPLGAAVLWFLTDWVDHARRRSALLLGITLGVCVATKVLLVAWVAGAFAAMLVTRRWRDVAFMAAATILSMAVCLIPIWGQLDKLLAGLAGLHQTNPFPMTLAEVVPRLAPWLIVTAVAAFFAASHFEHHRLPLVVFASVTIGLSFTAASMNPNPRYFLPSAIAVVALIASAGANRLDSWPWRAGFALIAVVLAGSLFEDTADHLQRLRSAQRTRAEVRRLIPEGAVVVYGFFTPFEAVALGTDSSARDRLEIATRYPRDGYFLPARRNTLYLPPGIESWDYLVIPRRRLEEFPEPVVRRIGSAGNIDVYAAPAD